MNPNYTNDGNNTNQLIYFEELPIHILEIFSLDKEKHIHIKCLTIITDFVNNSSIQHRVAIRVVDIWLDKLYKEVLAKEINLDLKFKIVDAILALNHAKSKCKVNKPIVEWAYKEIKTNEKDEIMLDYINNLKEILEFIDPNKKYL